MLMVAIILPIHNYLEKVLKRQEPRHTGTYLIELGKRFRMNTNMTGFKVIVKYFCNIVPWTKVDSASQGLKS